MTIIKGIKKIEMAKINKVVNFEVFNKTYESEEQAIQSLNDKIGENLEKALIEYERNNTEGFIRHPSCYRIILCIVNELTSNRDKYVNLLNIQKNYDAESEN